ncbi:MAG: SsrA-binding protein SmpB [Cyanobacteria bacterium HKST-UBA04]|nr:SsrA-binding protein SmpB [Cyanobacteria bacterium HKST-UBA04]MCA9840474.1 SsrA-binding protein SmpB [Cyanobacteria bacterium HKST-UBA03]
MSSKAGKAKKAKGGGTGTVVNNRRAFHDYHVMETYTAGIVLTGTEIKSIRAGKMSINEGFAKIENNEVFLYGSQIAPYEQGNIHNHAQNRTRKLLLSKREIKQMQAKVQEKGLTLIPLKVFFKGPWVKVELGVCQGKKLHDKRDTLKAKDAKRQIDRALKERS